MVTTPVIDVAVDVAIDVGGTFTDCVMRGPAGTRWVKVLTASDGATIAGIRKLLELPASDPLPPLRVRLGTTAGTNAILTRRGARAVLCITRGFGDALHIGTQERPELFELAIHKRRPLAERVIEIDERVAADGTVLRAPDRAAVRTALAAARADGLDSVAVCLLHGFAHPAHERIVAEEARAAGFTDVSVSSQVAPLEKLIPRGETTVLDAYLDPVLRRHLTGLAASLGPGSRLQIMTSSGGLVAADRFSGKDSLLSGPAGGAAGVARVAAAAGRAAAIGFDMGGTSTDVSRWSAATGFEMEYEAVKAGVRVMAPHVAIETVAAGGGSICGFDGVLLTVGPDSAGADPGPACYGRGGPLTITDCNLLLGRILAERFPFPLDRNAAAARADELARRAGYPSGNSSIEELAARCIALADAAMARAIRAVTVARGVDPADHVLVCFGGAGAQHACSLASELGIREVLVPPLAGVLSAYGIALADLRRHRERAVLQPCTATALGPLAAEADAMIAAATAEIQAESPTPVTARRMLDLRYEGVESAITIEAPTDWNDAAAWIAAYEDQHERLFGYRHTGRAVQIVALRTEVIGSANEKTNANANANANDPDPDLLGPAVLPGAGTTIFIPPGWHAAISAGGAVTLTDHRSPATTTDRPLALEIAAHHFASIAERMGIVLQRTASSTNVKERLDFSCALFTATGALVVNAPHIPVHLGAMAETVRAVIADAAASLAPGDVFVTNDPYRGGSHLPDVTVVTPVFLDGTLRGWVASRAHHAEIGGIVPGSMPPFSRSLAEEGVLLRNRKLVDRGRSREDELAALLAAPPYPSRRIADNLADIAAQVAANQTGVAALGELAARHGAGAIPETMVRLQQAAASRMRLALGRLPAGRRTFVDHLDDGTPIAVAIDLHGDHATIDFAGTGPISGNLNANRAIVTAAVLYCLRCFAGQDLPLNSGALEPIELRIPPGSLLDPPDRGDAALCAPVTGGNVETSQRLCDAILGALGLAAASQGTMNNLSFGAAGFGYYETICGGAGATPDDDGADAVHTHMTNTRLTDPEVLERRHPVRVVRFAIRSGSGGAGLHRGGDGAVRELEFLAPLRVSILSERRGPYAPYGLAGGAPGALGRNTLVRHGAGGAPTPLPAKVQLSVEPGDRLIIETPGGGGYGAPPDHSTGGR